MASTDWLVSRAATNEAQMTIAVPGDKSVSHRAVMFAGIAEGVSHVRGFLAAQDTQATAQIMRNLGVMVEELSPTHLRIEGRGLHGLEAPAKDLDCGNAGTGMRLLAGLLAGQAFDSALTGDVSLSVRPMRRVIDPLSLMGADIRGTDAGTPPLLIRGGKQLDGRQFEMTVASAQVKSAILIAGLYANGTTEVIEPIPTRDYTERLLQKMGAQIEIESGVIRVQGGSRLAAIDIDVPADFSSAAFPLLAGVLTPGASICLQNVGLHPTRTGLLKALELMGANIRIENQRELSGTSVGDIVAKYSPLKGIELPVAWVPDMIDELPVFFVAAALAKGQTTVRGAAELRVKESDRLSAMAKGLKAFGVCLSEHDDGMTIEGGAALGAADVRTFHDHRIAMALAVLAAQVDGESRISGVDNVATSFPGFEDTMRSLGIKAQRTHAS